MSNIVSQLQKKSILTPHKKACQLIEEGIEKSSTLTFSELDEKARNIAAFLQAQDRLGQRILLLFPAGLDFIASFMGCLYAGAIAVPVSCPDPEAFHLSMPQLQAIAEDADIAGILTAEPYIDQANQSFKNYSSKKDLFIIDIDSLSQSLSKQYVTPDLNEEMIAYLQYTSGSTAMPKAAIVTHQNLTFTLKQTAKVWKYQNKSITLTWAPHTHVYGLICGLLVPLYQGSLAIIMPTSAFIKKPANWLKAISHYKVTHSGCPNFGYDICVNDIKDEDLLGIQLSTWQFAINGGEKVRSETVKNFVQKFQAYGFHLPQINAAYGMSEVTGAIAVSKALKAPNDVSLDRKMLQENKLQFSKAEQDNTFIMSGTLLPGLKAVIVVPETLRRAKRNEIGEIWLSGPAVVSGYWRRPTESLETFGLTLPNDKARYFRTGDLGFMFNNEICVTGRLKELIIINGKKYYPNDVELAIHLATHAIQPGAAIVFSTLVNEVEELIVIREVNEELNHDKQMSLHDSIRLTLIKNCGKPPLDVILVKAHSILKTASGKLQRKKMLDQYLLNQLNKLDNQNQLSSKASKTETTRSAEENEFIQLMADILTIQPNQIDLKLPLSHYDFNSITMIKLTSLLNERYHLALSPALLYEYKTMQDFYQSIINNKDFNLIRTTTHSHTNHTNDIAIIGMSGIFPKADNIEEFWQNLVCERDCITEIPKERWDWQAYYGDPQNNENKTHIKWGGFINDVDHFDASFFNISPHEAELMDPQQRLFLTTTWNAIENAGYATHHLSTVKTGVFVGVFNHDYAELLQQHKLSDAYITTGLSHSIIANRISYLFNFNGPSEVIDTACSSSLVAIHHAVRSIQAGDCEVAIAGGVNALLTPTSYISANKAGMLSLDGRCKTFDEKANGYVRGEGVAAIVLKSLQSAIDDDDRIYAVIKGSAINHGGHVSSLTVPNPIAQSEVIIAAYERAKIDINTIDYIEAHGTGTPLGDPIEINGLKKAFTHLAKSALPNHYCGLGSVKTQIGHLESAAGIAGLIKILLAMKNDLIPANLHFNHLNPYINIDASPFYVVNKATPWQRQSEKRRRAGISSFGFGGSNAHIILEEPAELTAQRKSVSSQPYLICLSAKNTAALTLKANELKSWLAHQEEDISLEILSYTLLVARDHFAHRIVIIVDSIKQLMRQLDDTEPNRIYTLTSTNIDISALLLQAESFIQGKKIALDSPFAYQTKRRAEIPTYPFSAIKYWFKSKSLLRQEEILPLHPLIDSNTSTLTEHSYRKYFTNTDVIISDHVISKELIIPGAVYLEMAMVAAKLSTIFHDPIMLIDIIWYKTIKVSHNATEISIRLIPQGNASVFEVYENAGDSHPAVEGKIVYHHPQNEESATSVSVPYIQARLTDKISGQDLYHQFQQIGIEYGINMRTITEVAYNKNELVAHLELLERLEAENNSYFINPFLMDGVFQSTFVFLKDHPKQYLPFHIQQIRFFHALPKQLIVYAKLIEMGEDTVKFNIQIFDTNNLLLVDIRGFEVKVFHQTFNLNCYSPSWIPAPSKKSGDQFNIETLLVFDETGKTVAHLRDTTNKAIIWLQSGTALQVMNKQHYLLDMHQSHAFSTLLHEWREAQFIPNYIILQHASMSNLLADTRDGLRLLFSVTQALIQSKLIKQIKILNIVERNCIYASALAAFSKTANIENPMIESRVIEINELNQLNSELYEYELEVKYALDYTRMIKQFNKIDFHSTTTSNITLKSGGTYLITGGLGGLGLLFAKYLKQNFAAKLVLSGRTPLAELNHNSLEKLNNLGREVIYIRANVSNPDDIRQLVSRTIEAYGQLDGVIHSAGVVNDGFIFKKNISEIDEVVLAKIQGTLLLDEATKHLEMDFFVLFSSVASVLGNEGQSDYAYANAFLDAYASYRQTLTNNNMRKGRSLSISWPFWQEGGSIQAAITQETLANTIGIRALGTQEGMEIFTQALRLDQNHLVVLPGNQVKLKAALLQRSTYLTSPKQFESNLVDTHSLTFIQQVENYLRDIISASIKMPASKITLKDDFATYGIDSMMIIGLNHQFEKLFGVLPKTLFFEYHNLKELSEYFIENFTSLLSNLLDFKGTSTLSSSPTLPITVEAKKIPLKRETALNDIAIIGLSGRYAEANHLQTFWQNLKMGKNSITEIPKNRWLSDGHSYPKWGGFIEGVDTFDSLFFNISPRDAEQMDPQERLFLETAWTTIEEAGYSSESLINKKIGVFVGVMYGQYQLFTADTLAEHKTLTHSIYASIANRVSYFLNFNGPSMAIDTMCSSSLTAIHLACQSIKDGESEMALVGGVNLSIHPNKYLLLNQSHFLATDGKCHSFGEGGDGYVPGEGVGAVLLKSLAQALKDGDHIHAVIKGSSINHGGKTHGYTVPNPNAQTAVMAEAYAKANIDPASISYIEAHGTGTSLGDPIEIAGLSKIFTQRETPCAIGSVKSNIGHCESAAGMAALSKVILQMEHQTLVPSLHAEKLNANINWDDTVFKVQQTLDKWPAPDSGQPRRAGISSFGAGGSNAHLIVEEAPQRSSATSQHKPYYLFTLSAKTVKALIERINDLMLWSENNIENIDRREISLPNIAYTLNLGRKHFEYRCAVCVPSAAELIANLKTFIADPNSLDGYHNINQLPSTDNLDVFAPVIFDMTQKLSEIKSALDYRNQLMMLAKCYVDGHTLNWQKIHENESQLRLSLPTYSFAKDICWYNTTSKQVSTEKTFIAPAQNFVGKLSESVNRKLTEIFSIHLKMDADRLDKSKNVSEFGVDSINILPITQSINNFYQLALTPAIFYTYPNIKDISHYLSNEFSAAVMAVHPNQHEIYSKGEAIELNADSNLLPFKKTANQSSAIAIIGMQGMFPQSDDVNEFWEHLINRRDLISEIPLERWDWRDYFDSTKTNPHKSHSKWGGFIKHADQFDAAFFNISSREANLMDPQQRLFLEVAWKTIEDAGYNPLGFSNNKVGVFAGVEFNEYQTLISKQQASFHGFIATGNSHSMIANRVSYFFNFQGPSETINTACSSSLVAIHRAVNAIRNQECELALAGGVSLMLNPDTVTITSQLGALSSDGRCKTFDKSANGYVKGEGVASLLLKSLDQALADGDHIYGVIRHSGVNHGGKAQSFTAPNALAQSELIFKTYKEAGISPDSIDYIETHGTGTALGDPIEIEGLKLAFKQLKANDQVSRIGLGSVKTNIGHLEPASGIASVIKVLLALREETIPGNIHFNELNPFISLVDSPFYLLNQQKAWLHSNSSPRRAGISSFGFGGTNAHMIIEDAPVSETNHTQPKPLYLITLSAKTKESLLTKIKDLSSWIREHHHLITIEALCYTLNIGRPHLEERCAILSTSLPQLNELLSEAVNLTNNPNIVYSDSVVKIKGLVFDEIYHSVIQVLIQSKAHESPLYMQKLHLLADLYIKYYPIDWALLYANEQPLRVAGLPTYPFNKTRCWYDLNDITSKDTTPIMNSVRGSTTTYLQDIFADILRIPAANIAFDQTYEMYGVDSLIGLEITNRLEKDFGSLSKTILYERNTLNDLAAYFDKQHAAKLQLLIAPSQNVIDIPDENRPTLTTKLPNPHSSILKSEDIAIIGMSGIFPMADNINQFWDNLVSSKDCISFIPSDRWNYQDYPVMVNGENKYFKHGGFIENVDKFDPLFFNISPHDANLMDPQERLFMQTAWTTLENAGYNREKLRLHANNDVGVFVGATYNYYPLFIAEEWQKGNKVPLDIQMFSIANRVSHFLNVTGPSFVIDTACSSSLAAIHLACESLRAGECQMAIAGGVNLSLHPNKYHFLASFNFMSDEGRCRSFAEGGSGYVPSEGVGAVLLKPLSLAIKDNDIIHGVIKSSAINHGGKTSGYTVPNPNGQANVIKAALDKAHINPTTINYIEAHGTGTALGDPIEIRGLEDAFSTFTDKKQFCAIGSVKSNIGHCESAAGISQLIKVLLQMRHKKMAPSLHAEQLNPFIHFENSPFYLQREATDWVPPHDQLRRAGISSFGAGGTNVHVILDEYPIQNVSGSGSQPAPLIFLLSAVNSEQLTAHAQLYYDFLSVNEKNADSEWLTNLCFTTQTGRECMSARMAILAYSGEELIKLLFQFINMPEQTCANLWKLQKSQSQTNPLLDITTVMAQQHYDKLIGAWMEGTSVPWKNLPFNHDRQCIELPSYPFLQRRCWIPTISAASHIKTPVVIADPIESQPLEKTFSMGEWLYQSQWEEMPASRDLSPENLDGLWLIFHDNRLGFALADRLGKEIGIHCFIGEEFKQFSSDTYYINPNNPADFEKLFASIHIQHHLTMKGIIYLCPLGLEHQFYQPFAITNLRLINDASHHLIHLFQAVTKFKWSHSLLFSLITCHSQRIQPDDKIHQPLQYLCSLTRIFAVEYANYQVLLVDVDINDNLQHSADNVLSELKNYSGKQNHIAYRNGHKNALRLKVYSDTNTHENPAEFPICALITGGLGALGIEVAKWLVEKGTKYLLLTGMALLPERHTWDEMVDKQLIEKISALKALEASGIKVTYQAVNIADLEAMRAMVTEFEKVVNHPIDGVFHLAGVATDNIPIAKLDPLLISSVTSVKVKGSLVLHELFQHASLSCFMLFSSIAAVPYFGMSGLSTYAMANEFMDSLAAYRKQLGLPGTSINWVAWADKGMSFRHHHGQFLDAVGMAELPVRHGIALLDKLLQTRSATVIVTHVRWKLFLNINATASELDYFTYFSDYADTKLTLIQEERSEDEIMLLLIQSLCAALDLNFDEIDADVPFQNYGMDSILGIKYVVAISAYFPNLLTAMDLYRYPTLKKLSAYLSEYSRIKEQEVNFLPVETASLTVENEMVGLSDAIVSAMIEEELKELTFYD